MYKLILVASLIQGLILATEVETSAIQFVKSFIENEQKPTHLVYWLCWKRLRKQELVNYSIMNKKINCGDSWGRRLSSSGSPLADIYDENGLYTADTQVKLVNEVAKAGVRSSAILETSKYQDQGVLFLVDLDCPDAEEVMYNATTRDLLRSPYRWLALSNSNADQANVSFIWNSRLLADSEFVLAETTTQGFRLTELHKPSPTGPMHSTLRGYYNGSLIDLRPHRELFQRRKDLMGHPLIMANVIQESNSTQNHLEDRLELEYDGITKITWGNVKIAFEMLNATPQYIFSHRYGYKQNGQWSGMINDLHTGKAELGTSCLITKERLAVATYTDVVASFRLRFVLRQPPLSYVSNIFSLPFSSGVWIALVVCSAVSTAALFLSSRHEVRSGRSQLQLDGTIGDALLVTMSAVGQQGCAIEPKKASGRIMLWVLFTALMALYAAYSANIVVLLQAPSSSINTLAQLAHSKLTLAALDVDLNHFVFALETDPVRVEVYKKVDPEKGKKQFYDMNEGVERIRQGLFAFHSLVDPVYRRVEATFQEMEKCNLIEVDFINTFEPSMPIKKDSPYLELLRVAFKKIREAGIRKAISNRLQVPRPRCTHKGTAFSSVGLPDLMPVLILMLYGIAVSVATVLIEITVFTLHQRRISKTSA